MQLKYVTGTNRPYQGSTSTYTITADKDITEDDIRQYVAEELSAVAYLADANWYGKRITSCQRLDDSENSAGIDWRVVVHEPSTD